MIKGIIFDFNRTLYDPEKSGLYEGALNLLEKLAKKYKLALISYGLSDRKMLIRDLGIEKYFVKIIVVPEKKKEPLLECLLAFDCRPEETLVVGDRVKSEIKLANELGMVTCWLRRGKFAAERPTKPSEKPDFIIFSLSEVPEVLSDLNTK